VFFLKSEDKPYNRGMEKTSRESQNSSVANVTDIEFFMMFKPPRELTIQNHDLLKYLAHHKFLEKIANPVKKHL
jgi:hypothetical protein